MDALCSLWLKSSAKEAVFTALWLALGESPGTFRDVSVGDVVRIAARFGVGLSESQAGKRLKELEALGVVAKVANGKRGRFDLIVYRPAPEVVEPTNDAKPEPTTAPAKTLFDFVERSGEIGGESRGEIGRQIGREIGGENGANALNAAKTDVCGVSVGVPDDEEHENEKSELKKNNIIK